MKKIAYLLPAIMLMMLLSACKIPFLSDGDSGEDAVPEVIEFPTDTAPVTDQRQDDNMAMDHEDMMMETAALKEECEVLQAKTSEEKTAILDDIGHNMDKDALDYLLGEECPIFDDLEKVADLTEDDVKLIPGDSEELWFSPSANRFFATCKSANTVAYVVEMTEEADSVDYFTKNRDLFVAAATMAKDMMEMMEDEHEMMEGEGMEGGGKDEEDLKDADDSEEGDKVEEMEDVEDAEDVDEIEEQAAASGQYTAYADGVIGNGMESVLFFHATWCPMCQANNKRLLGWYGSEEFPLSVYKIDYDTSDTLKQQFGIVQQDTFVLIDGEGNMVDQVSFPSESRLKELISG